MSSKSDYRVKTQQQIKKVHLRGGKDESMRLTCSVLFMLRGKQMSLTSAQISESGLQQFNRLYVWAQRFLKNQITLPRIAWEIKNMPLNTPLLLKGWITQKWTFDVYLWRINVLCHSRRKRSVACIRHSLFTLPRIGCCEHTQDRWTVRWIRGKNTVQFLTQTDCFVSLDLNVSSRAAWFNLVLSVYVFLSLKAVEPIDLHYITDKLQLFELEILVCVLHLGYPAGGTQINITFTFLGELSL